MSTGPIRSPDLNYIQRYLSDLLLRKLWAPETGHGVRAEIFSQLVPGVRVETPPIIGVGISEWETREGRTLEFLSTVDPRVLRIEEFLRRQNLGGIPNHVTPTGRAVACVRPAQGGDSIGHHNGD